MVELRINALALHLGIDTNEIEVSTYSEDTLCYGDDEYLVLTDSEANDKWDEWLDNYVDECILSELPKNLRNYFDADAWKNDAKFDGRGHALSSYDCHENSIWVCWCDTYDGIIYSTRDYYEYPKDSEYFGGEEPLSNGETMYIYRIN